MGIFDAFRRNRGGGGRAGLRRASPADLRHLEEWAAARHGVEAYVEPRTTVTETTVMLIAHDGEWTRRRIDSLAAAQQLGSRLSLPVYEVDKVGYPRRMREYRERQRRRPGSG